MLSPRICSSLAALLGKCSIFRLRLTSSYALTVQQSSGRFLGRNHSIQAANCTGIIILADLDKPVATSLNKNQLDMLKQIMRPGMVILWVTKYTGVDPERAACLGLTRSFKAEVPDLILQVLDLDTVENCHVRIFETFGQLARSRQSNSSEIASVLWSTEPEIDIKNGKRFVPRVLPYEPANARLNAYRRPLTCRINTSECCLLLQGFACHNGSIRYKTSNIKNTRASQKPTSGTVRICVEYSSS